PRRARRDRAPARRRHRPPRAGPRAAARGTVRHLHPQHDRAVPPRRAAGNGPGGHRVKGGMSPARSRIPGRAATRAAAGLTGLALAAGLTLLTGCTSRPPASVYRDSSVPANSLRLVAFESCDDALGKLKQAASQYVGPWG